MPLRLFLKNLRLHPSGIPAIRPRRGFCSDQECAEERKGLILGVYEGENEEPIFTKAAAKFNDHLGGKLLDLVKSGGCELKRGQGKTFNNVDKEFWSIAMVGLGKEKLGYCEMEAIDEGLEAVREAAGMGAQLLKKECVGRILIEGLGHPEQAAEGSALALWRYQENRSRQHWKPIPTLELFDDSDAESFQRGLFKAESQNLARRLSDTPANQMTPLHFAQETVNELCPCGIKVMVHDKDWVEHKKMNAFLTVARGSCEPPVVVEISYCGRDQDHKPILLVGKGITFDSGGLCLKKCDGMDKYRGDMVGAAAIIAAIRAASALSLPINIEAIIPLCENMPSGMSMKCGDVVMGLNGKSIMITDTDNEGRLVLADALVYAQNICHPNLIIDVATLTPGVRAAFGSAACGVFTNSQTMWSQVRKAGIITGDRVWRLPLWKYFTKKVTRFKSHDVNNKGLGHGSSCIAAAFVNEFIDCVDWIHFDVTGVGFKSEEKNYPYLTKGRMTGRPTRTLIQLPIIHMGWSTDEKLICIQDDGNVTIYDMFGKLFHKFNVFQKIHDSKLVDAKVFTNTRNVTGIAVMTSNYHIFIINSIKDIKTRQLSDVPRSNNQPTCWEIVSEEASTDVLFARGNKELYRLKQDEHHTSTMLQPDISVPYTAILEMSVSLNARHLCFFTDSGHLWLGSTDLRRRYCEIATMTVHRPKQLVWCGNETVVAYWEQDHSILIVGKNGQSYTFNADSSVHLVAEIDGVRIISNSNHELLQKVPEVVQKIFRINSTESGSFLLEASKQFQKGSHKANEYITLVKSNIEEAVNQCLDAVGYEFDTEIQKMLIRAAQFGKCFVAGMSCDKYVKMCRLLRVLNAVRSPKVGIPLTIEQLKYMRLKESAVSEENESLKNLLDRLIVRNMYFLALQIAKYLQLPESVGSSYILVHWAKYKVSQPHPEEEAVAREIAEKLGYSSGVSYREIAEKASEFGKNKLAIKLLDYESKASEQVELLLKLHENKSALHKAVESGDTDLVYMVVLKLRDSMPLGDFKMTIRNFPVAQSLYIKYCKEYYKPALTEIYNQEDDFASQAQLVLEKCLGDKKSLTIDSELTSAAENYRKARKDLNASLCEENLKLLKLQRELEDKLQVENKLLGKSVHDTCKSLLEMKEVKLAEKMKNDFKIPEKRYWYLRINTLAKQKEWIELDKFSKVKKSPIGYGPFVDACWACGNKDEALKYLAKIPEELKAKYYVKIECFAEASDAAFLQRDAQMLANIKCRLTNKHPQLLEKVTDMLERLQNGN